MRLFNPSGVRSRTKKWLSLYDIIQKKCNFEKKIIPGPSSKNFYFYLFGQRHVYSNQSLRSSVRQMPKKVL